MRSTVTKNDNNTVTLTVTLEGEDWSKAQKKAVAKTAAGMNIKGFRKGKVPAGVVRRLIGEEGLLQMALEAEAQKALEAALDEHDAEIELIDRPTLEVRELTKDNAVLDFVCPVAPEVTLGQWKDLGIEKEEVTVTDEDVDNALSALLRSNSEQELADDDQPAQDGDTLTIDYEGYVDGEQFNGGTAQNQEVVLGSGRFIPGFEEQLVGVKTGEEKDLNVTFPEDYQGDLAGKDAVFKVKVNEVFQTKLPELDDEFAKNQTTYKDVSTVDELKDAIRKAIEAQRQDKADDAFYEALLTAVKGNTDLDIPEVMIQSQIDDEINQLAAQLGGRGVDMNQLFKMMGQDLQEYRDSLYEGARDRVANTLILEAIARDENLSVSDEELSEALKEFAEEAGMDVEEITKRLPQASLRRSLLLDKASEALVNAQGETASDSAE